MNEVAGRTESQAVIDQFLTRFEKLAGSRENARSLVVGLRTGQEIVIKGRGPDGKPATVAFTPPTGTMSFGNVFLTLSIVQDALTARGYAQPGPEQLQTALMGGKLTVAGRTDEMKGILVRRLTGEGWGIIASTMGIDLDPIVSGMRTERERFPAVALPNQPPVNPNLPR